MGHPTRNSDLHPCLQSLAKGPRSGPATDGDAGAGGQNPVRSLKAQIQIPKRLVRVSGRHEHTQGLPGAAEKSRREPHTPSAWQGRRSQALCSREDLLPTCPGPFPAGPFPAGPSAALSASRSQALADEAASAAPSRLSGAMLTGSQGVRQVAINVVTLNDQRTQSGSWFCPIRQAPGTVCILTPASQELDGPPHSEVPRKDVQGP